MSGDLGTRSRHKGVEQHLDVAVAIGKGARGARRVTAQLRLTLGQATGPSVVGAGWLVTLIGPRLTHSVGTGELSLLSVGARRYVPHAPALRFLEGFLMKSMKCGHDNRAGAKLCEECAAPRRIHAAEPTFADRQVSARSNCIGRTHLMQSSGMPERVMACLSNTIGPPRRPRPWLAR
jgi:hypothetical protein